MPIYAYRCEACGFAKDVLQKMSDDTLTVCPQCQADAFKKQITAAGFQLKGSGWYVTDFRDGNKAATANSAPKETSASDSATSASSEPSSAETKPTASARDGTSSVSSTNNSSSNSGSSSSNPAV